MERNRALLVVFICELVIIVIVFRSLLLWITFISLLYAFRYTQVWCRKKKRRKSKSVKVEKPKKPKDLGKALEVRQSNDKVSKSQQNYVEPDKELTLIDKSLVGLPISLDDVNDIDGEEFETILFNRFKSMGFTVYYTPVSGDFGADLIVETDNNTVVIQVKRYNFKQGRSVGVKAVQEVLGAIVYYRANRGLVITNAVFTGAAKELAITAKNITLWDREDLKKYLNFI